MGGTITERSSCLLDSTDLMTLKELQACILSVYLGFRGYSKSTLNVLETLEA